MERRKHGQGGSGGGNDNNDGTNSLTAPSIPPPPPVALSSIPPIVLPVTTAVPSASIALTTSAIKTAQLPATPSSPGPTSPITPPQDPSSGPQSPPVNAGNFPPSNNDPRSTSQSPIPTNTPNLPSSPSPGTELLQFQTPSNSTVCESLELKWMFIGHELFTMTLYIQPRDIASHTTAGTQQIPPSAHILSTNISVTNSSYTWSPVIADTGFYVANSFDNRNSSGLFMRSSPFFIGPPLNGSCLQTLPNNSSTSALNRSQKSGPSDGAIIGLSVGITAGVALLLVAFLYPRFWRKELPSHDRNRPYLLY